MKLHEPILYSFRRCPYAMRARLALWSSGQTVILREVALGAKPPELLEASPKGTVPVLAFEKESKKVIEQSLDIMLWALRESDPEGWLDHNLNEALELIAVNDGEFKLKLDHYKYPERYGLEATGARHAALPFLARLEHRLLESGKDYLFRESPTLADNAIFPFIRQFANVDKVWFDELPYPKLRKWLYQLISSVEFEAVMQRFEPWKPGDEPRFWGRLAVGQGPQGARAK